MRSGFLRSCERFPDRPVLEVDGKTVTYQQLRRRAASLAATLIAHSVDAGPALTAILTDRSVTAFAGILAALFRGHGFVPLSIAEPAERATATLLRSGCRSLIVDRLGVAMLDEVLQGIEEPMLIVLPDQPEANAFTADWPQHTFLGSEAFVAAERWKPVEVEPDTIAYLLFTSGSTGVPKGVMISHENIRYFIDVMVHRYVIDENDRFSQTFPMIFDLSIFDMFVAWERGACVCCPSKEDLMMSPNSYIRDSGITIWFSTPSMAMFMKNLKMLEPGQYPNLRVSLFCGEALPLDVTDAWALAAPNSIVENLYGPTEVTLCCTLYRYVPQRTSQLSQNGVVPIGVPYPGMTAMVTDEAHQEVPPGQVGELLVAGPQVALGYYEDTEKTAAAFVRPPGHDSIYYCTGDRVRRPDRDSDPLIYLGRMDSQIQIHGARVELGEIEAVIREVSNVDNVAALGWPHTAAGADSVVGFIEAEDVDVNKIRRLLRDRLPSFMVPKRIHLMSKFPRNASGKTDRKALVALLESQN